MPIYSICLMHNTTEIILNKFITGENRVYTEILKIICQPLFVEGYAKVT